MRTPSRACAPCRVAIAIAIVAATASLAAQSPPTAPKILPVSWDDVLQQPREWYAGAEARRIADNVRLYQRTTGGWPKNIDMARVLAPAERERVVADKQQFDSTIDNGATWRQLRYLARVFNAVNDAALRDSFLAGLDFLLRAEHAKGGWPQIYPLRRDYSRHITFNDGATINVASLLREIAATGEFAFVAADRRARASAAVNRAVQMMLAAQIRVNGQLSAWCAQHDAETFAPRAARVYEPVSLSGMETVDIVEFLIAIPKPTAEVVSAVDAAVDWLRSVRIEGVRVERVPAPGLTPNFDLKVVADPLASPLWARFYEIGTNRPMFLGRDGVVKYELASIDHERRTGYSWLGPYAATLLGKHYPAWQARLRTPLDAKVHRHRRVPSCPSCLVG